MGPACCSGLARRLKHCFSGLPVAVLQRRLPASTARSVLGLHELTHDQPSRPSIALPLSLFPIAKRPAPPGRPTTTVPLDANTRYRNPAHFLLLSLTASHLERPGACIYPKPVRHLQVAQEQLFARGATLLPNNNLPTTLPLQRHPQPCRSLQQTHIVTCH